MEGFNSKWLTGKKFRSSKAKKVEENGRKKTVYEASERAMKQEDVLSFRVDGDQVTIVTADGQKFTVTDTPDKKPAKTPAKGKAEKPGGEDKTPADSSATANN